MYSAFKTMVVESPLTSVNLHHDGSTLAVGSTRGKIYIYDLRQGTTPLRVIPAHRSSVQSLQFTHRQDKDKVCSASLMRPPYVPRNRGHIREMAFEDREK